MPSLAHSTNHSTNAIHEPLSSSGITKNISGDSSSRPTVTALAQVASALGFDRHQTSVLAASTAVGSDGDEVGPERVDDLDRRRTRPRRDRRRRAMMPSISGASRCVRPTPGASTSTRTVVPISASRRRGGDVVLQLAQLGEPLVHQRVGRPAPSSSAAYVPSSRL